MPISTAADKQDMKAAPDYSVVRWYALTHWDPESLKKKLEQLNEQALKSGEGVCYKYFIPYSFIVRRIMPDKHPDDYNGLFSEDEARHNNQIRATLRHFVFIRATGRQIQKLLRSDWNRNSVRRLQPYAAHADDMKYVSDTMMDSFIGACYDLRERFELTPYSEGLGIGAEVIISKGRFKSARATVKDFCIKNGGLCLTLAVSLFAQSVDITLYDVDASKVSVSPDCSSFISFDYANHIESQLLDILSRRINRKETPESHEADLKMLSTIWRLRPTRIDDRYMNARVQALSLICARLRYDIAAQQQLLPRILALLQSHEQKSLTQRNAQAIAILHIALFVATKDPAHRATAKELVFRFTEEKHPLRRFISLLRR